MHGQLPSYPLPKDTDKWKYLGWIPVVTTATQNKTYTSIRKENNYKINSIVLVDKEVAKIVVLGLKEKT